jgi:hypothetical protein
MLRRKEDQFTIPELHGDVKVHSKTGGAQRVSFGLEPAAGVDNVFAAVLD